jgi:tRNA pseudouridine55 synthase
MSFMDGVLIIDKPTKLTSHDVVARVRRILQERRVGHTGTLDPFATGVLVVLLGRATRLAQFLSGAEKEYQAVIRLGYATDTGDVTGKRIADDNKITVPQPVCTWSDSEIEAAFQNLRGEIEQVPPMYSAKKHGGRKLYELARRGEEIERKPVRVNVSSFEALRQGNQLLTQNEDGTCDLAVRVVCSAGTYVRSLAESFGQNLGVGAHLAELRRTRAGEFGISDAISLDALQEKVNEPFIATVLLSPDAALGGMPFVNLSPSDAQRARHGLAIPVKDGMHAISTDGEKVRMRDETGNLVGIASFDTKENLLRPRVVLNSTD